MKGLGVILERRGLKATSRSNILPGIDMAPQGLSGDWVN